MIEANTNNVSGPGAFIGQTTIKMNKNPSLPQLETATSEISLESAQYSQRESMLKSYYKKLVARANSLDVNQENISDKSFMVETTNLSKTRIMSDASAAILAQASKSRQVFISLLESDI
jgi:flagellin